MNSNKSTDLRNVPKCLDVVCTIGSSREIGQVKLNLVPAFIKSHRHGTDEWLHTSRTLVVGSSESTTDALVIQYLDLESEVFLQLLRMKTCKHL